MKRLKFHKFLPSKTNKIIVNKSLMIDHKQWRISKEYRTWREMKNFSSQNNSVLDRLSQSAQVTTIRPIWATRTTITSSCSHITMTVNWTCTHWKKASQIDHSKRQKWRAAGLKYQLKSQKSSINHMRSLATSSQIIWTKRAFCRLKISWLIKSHSQ